MQDYIPGGMTFLDMIRFGAGAEGYAVLALLVVYVAVAFLTRSAMVVIAAGIVFCFLEIVTNVISIQVGIYCMIVNVMGAIAISRFSKVAD